MPQILWTVSKKLRNINKTNLSKSKLKKKWRFCKKWTNLEIKIKKKSFKRKIGNYTGKAKRKIKTVFTEISISSAMFKNSFITKGFSFFHFDFESCYTLEHDILTFSFAFGKWLANKIQLPSSINLLTAKKKLYVLFVFEKKWIRKIEDYFVFTKYTENRRNPLFLLMVKPLIWYWMILLIGSLELYHRSINFLLQEWKDKKVNLTWRD